MYIHTGMVKAQNGVMGSLSQIAAAALLFHTSHEYHKDTKENMNSLFGMVYLHQHSLDASGKTALERMLAGDSVVLDLLQLLCVGLVCLLLELGNDL